LIFFCYFLKLFETNFDSIDQQQQTYKNQNELSSVTSDQQQSNTNQILEMDWNDTDFLQLFNEIDALNST